jgi:hypothetical protein
LGSSIIDLLSFLHDGRNGVHVAMTTQQGMRAKNYLEKFINKEPLIRQSVVKQNTKEVRLNIDGEEVGLEILPATPKAVQGAHCSFLSFDELASSMEPSNVRAYSDAHGIIGSSSKGKPGVIVKITSRQQGFSLAEQELRDAGKTGLRVLKWTTLDATERCPDDRSGTVSTPLWINPLKGEKYTDEEFKEIPAAKQDGFILTNDTFEKCRECPIAAFCAGDLKKQKSTSQLLRTIDDVINKIRMAGSWDWAVAQIMSMQPEKSGLIYFEFDRQIHIPGWEGMWKTLTGVDPAGPINRDMFVSELKRRGASFVAGVDWGWSAPSTCVVLAIDRREFVYVMDVVSRTYTPDPEFIELLRTGVHRKYDIQMYCPDLANGSGNALLRQAGLPTTDDIDKSINLGINLVKGLLRIPGTNHDPRILFAPDLPRAPGINGIVEEFELYHKKVDATGKVMDNEDPAPEHDHHLDALRYCIYWLFGRMRMQIGSQAEANAQAARPASNMPSLEEIARQHGIQFVDNRDEGPRDPGDDLGGPTGPIWSWT